MNVAEKNLSKIQKCKQITTTELAKDGINPLKRTYQRYKNVSKSQLIPSSLTITLAEKNLSKIQKCKQITTSGKGLTYVVGLKRTYQRYKNVSKSQRLARV